MQDLVSGTVNVTWVLRFWPLLAVMFTALSLASAADRHQKPTLRLNKRDLTVLGSTIGSSSRPEIERRLGKTEVFRTSRAEEADDVICYRSAAADDDTVVVFSFGAMGGWIDLTQISIAEAWQLPKYARACRKITLVSRQVEFLRGLKLGSSRENVLRRLGPASKSSDKELFYYVSHECSATNGGGSGTGASSKDSPCEVVDSVTARFKKGSLVYVSLYQFVDK